MEYINLKEEFISIQNKFVGGMLNASNIYKMEIEIKELFERFDIDDLKFVLVIKNGRVVFDPTGNLNKLATKGIMAIDSCVSPDSSTKELSQNISNVPDRYIIVTE